MEFTEQQLEILYRAWVLDRNGCGQVLEQESYSDALELEEAGWLEGRTVDANGDTAWFWTGKAETALDLNALTESVQGREN